MSNQKMTPDTLMSMENVAQNLGVSYGDIKTILHLHNSLRPSQQINEEYDIIRDDGDVFIRYSDFQKLQTCLEQDVISIGELEKTVGISAGDIKHMCDMCFDDRYSSLLPDEAKVRPIAINGTYYIQTNYIPHFDERYAKFNEVIENVIEKANEIDAMEMADRERELETSQYQQQEEEKNEEVKPAEEEVPEEDIIEEDDKPDTRGKRRREANAKANAEYQKRFAEEQERYQRELANTKMLEQIAAENKRLQEGYQEPVSSSIVFDNTSEKEARLKAEEYQKQADEARERYNKEVDARREAERKAEETRQAEEKAREEYKKAEENRKLVENNSSESSSSNAYDAEKTAREEYERANNARIEADRKLQETYSREFSAKMQAENEARIAYQAKQEAEARAKAMEDARVAETARMQAEQAKQEAERIRNSQTDTSSREAERASIAEKEEQIRIAEKRAEDAMREARSAEERMANARREIENSRLRAEQLARDNSVIRKIEEDRKQLIEQQQRDMQRNDKEMEERRNREAYQQQFKENEQKSSTSPSSYDAYHKTNELKTPEYTETPRQSPSSQPSSSQSNELNKPAESPYTPQPQGYKQDFSEPSQKAQHPQEYSQPEHQENKSTTLHDVDKSLEAKPKQGENDQKPETSGNIESAHTYEDSTDKKPPTKVQDNSYSSTPTNSTSTGQQTKEPETSRANQNNQETQPSGYRNETHSFNEKGLINDFHPVNHAVSAADALKNIPPKTEKEIGNGVEKIDIQDVIHKNPNSYSSQPSDKQQNNEQFVLNSDTSSDKDDSRITSASQNNERNVGGSVSFGASDATDGGTLERIDNGTTKLRNNVEGPQTTEQTKNTTTYSQAYASIDYHDIANKATNHLRGNIARSLSQTDVGMGIAHVGRTARAVYEITVGASNRSGVEKAVADFVKSNQTVTSRTIDRLSGGQSARVFMKAIHTKSESLSSKANDLIMSSNREVLSKSGVANVANMSKDEMFAIAKEKNIQLIDTIDTGFGLRIKHMKQSVAVDKELNSILSTKGFKTGTSLSNKQIDDLLKDKNIRINKRFVSELNHQKTLNGLIEDAKKAGVLNLDTEEGMAQFIGNLTSKPNGKQLQKIMMARTGIAGYDSKFKKINVRKVGKSRVASTFEMQQAENSLSLLVERLALRHNVVISGRGFNVANVKNLNAHSLLKMAEKFEDVPDLALALKAFASVKSMGQPLTRSFMVNAFRSRARAISRALRGTAQQNSAFAAYYDLKGKVSNIRAVHNMLKTLKKMVRNRRHKVVGKIQRKINRRSAGGKSTKRLTKKQNKIQKKIDKTNKKITKKNNRRNAFYEHKNTIKTKIKEKTVGRLAKTRFGKGLSRFKIKITDSKPFKALSKFSKLLGKPFQQLARFLNFLKSLIGYILIGIGILILVILYLNVMMYVVGTVGGMITDLLGDFFHGLVYENIMDGPAQKTLVTLQNMDSTFFEVVDDMSQKASSEGLKAVGINDAYGFVDAKNSNNGVPNRFKIEKPGSPYGVGGYSQHFYDGSGKEISKFSNAKDIVSVSYAGYDGECARWFSSYSKFNINLWGESHVCQVCNESVKSSYSIEDGKDDWLKNLGAALSGSSGTELHCHATNVYPCATGKCDGTNTNTYVYYCNPSSPEQSNEQKQTKWVYDATLWKNNYTLSPTEKKDQNKYLCVVYGDSGSYAGKLVTTTPKGCVETICTPNGKRKNKEIVYNGVTYKKDANGNKISYELLSGKQGDGKDGECTNSTLWYHNRSEQYYCLNYFYVKVDGCDCGGYCTNGSYYNTAEGAASYQVPADNCDNKKKVTMLIKCDDEKLIPRDDEDKHFENIPLYYNYECTQKVMGINSNGNRVHQTANFTVPWIEDASCKHAKTINRTEIVSLNVDGTKYYCRITYPVKVCGGKKQSKNVCAGHCYQYNHEVCGGHLKCNGHQYCPGHTMTYCKGHVDAYTSVKILGINDQEFFTAGQKVADNMGKTDVSNRLKNNGTQEWAMEVYNGDWQDLYGIFIAGRFDVPTKMSPAEIASIMKPYENDNSPGKNLVVTAFNAVAKIPYYDRADVGRLTFNKKINESEDWDNQFKAPVVDKNGKTLPDSSGRVMSGLNPKDFVAYTLWSANFVPGNTSPSFDTAKKYLATSTKSDLKIGDILINESTGQAYIYFTTTTNVVYKTTSYYCITMDSDLSTVTPFFLSQKDFDNLSNTTYRVK